MKELELGYPLKILAGLKGQRHFLLKILFRSIN
jgi:hypothetical protein